MKIINKPINELIEADHNPRQLSKKQYQQIKDSIERFGIVDPIIVNINPKRKNIIVGGHQRVRVSKDLGIEVMPCVEVNLTLKKEKELNIRLNKNVGQWDFGSLANFFEAKDLLDWGFDNSELSFLEDNQAQEDDYQMPDDIKTDIAFGDIIEIGNHKLLCGDSTNVDDVAKLMDGKKSDMVFTDPPYNIDYVNIKHPKFKSRQIENDNMTSEEFHSFCSSFADNIKKFNTGCVYVCGAPGKDGRIMFTELDDAMYNSTVIIWNKDQFTLGRGKYQNKYEPIWFGWINNGITFYGDRKQTNVWDIPRSKANKDHPTVKPTELISKAITHASLKGDLILDLFMGSGSTMVASHQLNRKCYGIEIDPKYCQVIVDRMKELEPGINIKTSEK